MFMPTHRGEIIEIRRPSDYYESERFKDKLNLCNNY